MFQLPRPWIRLPSEIRRCLQKTGPMTSSDVPSWVQLLLQTGLVGGTFSILTLLITGRQSAASRRHERSLAREGYAAARDLAQQSQALERSRQWQEKKEAALLAFQDEAIAQVRILDEKQVIAAGMTAGTVLEHVWDHERLFQLLCRARAFSSSETNEAASRLRQAIVNGSNSLEVDETAEELTAALNDWLEQVHVELASEA